MKQLFIGVDGGASKTSAVLIDARGKVLVTSETGGSNVSVFGLKKSAYNIKSAVKMLTGELDNNFEVFGCFAIAGIDTSAQKKAWEKAIKEDIYFLKLFLEMPLIVNDTLAALRSGADTKDAIVVISGTGSNCFGKNRAGKFAKSGGLDFILSDEGSAFFIGSMILRAIIKSIDGRGNKTLLSDYFAKTYKVKTIDEIVSLVYKKTWGKVEIARVSQVLEKALEANDEKAREIAGLAVKELASMIFAVSNKLGFEKDDSFTLVKSGSVFKVGFISRLFDETIRKKYPKARVVLPNMSAAQGAAYLALENFSNPQKAS